MIDLYLILKFALVCGIISYFLYGIWIYFNPLPEKIREELSNIKKQYTGTPSGGGIIFSLVSIIASLINTSYTRDYLLLISVIIILGVIGYIDDFYKRTTGSGLSESIILTLSILTGCIPAAIKYLSYGGGIFIPLFNKEINLGIFYILFSSVLVFTGSTVGCNLTDGFNGGLVFSAVLGTIFYICYFLYSIYIAGITGFYSRLPLMTFDHYDIFLYLCSLLGSLFAFWIYNQSGKIFMGNIGSLIIGGIFGAISILTGTEFFLIFILLLPCVEVCSIILQNIWLKLFNRKLFLFTPIHHHFELKGWSSISICAIMWSIQLLGIIIAALLILY